MALHARWRVTGATVAFLAAAIALLSVPGAEPRAEDGAPGRPFTWARDSLWRSLEAGYVRSRAAGCDERTAGIAASFSLLNPIVDRLGAAPVGPGDAAFDSLETGFFTLGARVAACPAHLRDYVRLYERMREVVKLQARRWDVNNAAARDRLYRSLYGGRAAVEEVMLQHPDSIVPLLEGVDEPSATPGTVVHGVEIHSGDVLVSRGGYPTSALIARGNDHPGNFSHIGLVHVDETTHVASVIEAHIERGVAITTADAYLRDRKLRIMVLRMRADLRQLRADGLLPHRAATRALTRARSGHVPYDFAMDYRDPSRLFCSEVASSAFREVGVNLWMGVSTISRPGLRRWLSSFGVRHFETQEPSDLEYDPQLVVVAEWRDAASLSQDHVDNAVTDAMLEGADRGDGLTYPWYALAPTRLAKAYSWVLERLGRVGPVPEGMSAEAALRNRAFSARHRRIAERVRARAARVEADQGYPPPYWTLVDLAREATK
jgi:hypothetical protein